MLIQPDTVIYSKRLPALEERRIGNDTLELERVGRLQTKGMVLSPTGTEATWVLSRRRQLIRDIVEPLWAAESPVSSIYRDQKYLAA